MYLSSRTEKKEFKRKYKSGIIATVTGRHKTWYKFKCDTCGTEYEKDKSHIGSTKRLSNDYTHFCKKCFSHAAAADLGRDTFKKNQRKRIGEKTIDSLGYVRIYVGDTHQHSKGYCGSIREHVMQMENHLGRKLEKGEVVHHIDGNKTNNNLDNLDLCTVQEHNKCHSASEGLVFELYKKGLVRYDRKQKLYFVV